MATRSSPSAVGVASGDRIHDQAVLIHRLVPKAFRNAMRVDGEAHDGEAHVAVAQG